MTTYREDRVLAIEKDREGCEGTGTWRSVDCCVVPCTLACEATLGDAAEAAPAVVLLAWACPAAKSPHPATVAASDPTIISILAPLASFLVDELRLTGCAELVISTSFEWLGTAPFTLAPFAIVPERGWGRRDRAVEKHPAVIRVNIENTLAQ